MKTKKEKRPNASKGIVHSPCPRRSKIQILLPIEPALEQRRFQFKLSTRKERKKKKSK